MIEDIRRDTTSAGSRPERSVGYFFCPATNQTGWYPLDEIRLPITDLGFRQAVTAVERLRTYDGRLFHRQDHLERFVGTLQSLGLSHRIAESAIDSITNELFDRNRIWIEKQGDIGVTWWVTPDSYALHCNRIDHESVAQRRENGQPVVLTSVQQPGARSWSRQAKVRSRLHYYLADQEANSIRNESTGVLCDEDGTWTETSIANLAIVFGETLMFPLSEQVLNGVTQSLVREIASELGIQSIEQGIHTCDMANADEILLMGTDTGLWFASEVRSFDGILNRQFDTPGDASISRRLQACMPQSR